MTDREDWTPENEPEPEDEPRPGDALIMIAVAIAAAYLIGYGALHLAGRISEPEPTAIGGKR